MVPESTDLPEFPLLHELCAYVDAAHGTDLKTQCSVTGIYINIVTGTVAYKCKLQPMVATFSMEAEFLAFVLAAKMVLCLCMILSELGYPESNPMKLHVDNQAAIAIVNKN